MFNIKISYEESIVLRLILERVGGSSKSGRRHADSLMQKLCDQHLGWTMEKEEMFPISEDDHINFKG